MTGPLVSAPEKHRLENLKPIPGPKAGEPNLEIPKYRFVWVKWPLGIVNSMDSAVPAGVIWSPVHLITRGDHTACGLEVRNLLRFDGPMLNPQYGIPCFACTRRVLGT